MLSAEHYIWKLHIKQGRIEIHQNREQKPKQRKINLKICKEISESGTMIHGKKKNHYPDTFLVSPFIISLQALS